MTAFSKTILGKILGGAGQVIATPLGLGNVVHTAIDKVADSAQNLVSGRARANNAKAAAAQADASDAQNKVTQVGLNVQTGGGGTSVSGYLNSGTPSASGFLQGAFYWIQRNIMVVIGIVAIYFIFFKKKKRR